MKNVTVVITTCNRTDLLERTLVSFFKFNTYPISRVIIVEDSGVKQNFNIVRQLVPCELIIIENEQNLGQIASIDHAYSLVNTDYIFHCEEDWEFYEGGFIEKSFEILETNEKIFTVWLRSHTDTKNHAIIKDQSYALANDDHYYLLNQFHKKVWCGFTFNPGLRRTKDCMLLHPYDKLEVRKTGKKNGMIIMHEMDLSIYYQELGFRGAITSKDSGYVRHIGGKRHVPLPWQR
jgi:glycosyltransferase involved in cell wall biosynthesis